MPAAAEEKRPSLAGRLDLHQKAERQITEKEMIGQLLQPILRELSGVRTAAGGEVQSSPRSMEDITCSFGTRSTCLRYADGCFDYSPQYCKNATRPGLVPPAPSWKRPPAQKPATLWVDPPTSLPDSNLSVEEQLCAQRVCDRLDPVEASLCECLATASDARSCSSSTQDAATTAQRARLLCAPVVMGPR